MIIIMIVVVGGGGDGCGVSTISIIFRLPVKVKCAISRILPKIWEIIITVLL